MFRITDMVRPRPNDMLSEREDFGRLLRIPHVAPLGEIRRVGPGALLSVLSSLERETAPTVIREKNGRRHEVDFGDAPVRVEIYSGEETVEVFNTPLGWAPGGVFVSAARQGNPRLSLSRVAVAGEPCCE